MLLEDVMPHSLHHAQEYIRSQLGEEALGDTGVGGVAFVSTIEDAVRDADLAIDCVPDELESKLEILWLLDRMAPPRTVLATPTIRLSITDLASCTYRPGQVIAIAQDASSLCAGTGPGIELRSTSGTTRRTVALVEAFWRQLGFLPQFTVDTTPVKPAYPA